MVFGGPLIGLTAEPGELPDAVALSGPRLFVGFEVLHYIRQFRAFLESTWDRLDWLGRNAWLVGDVERRFLRRRRRLSTRDFRPRIGSRICEL